MPMRAISCDDRVTQTVQDNAVAAVAAIESATQVTLTSGAASKQAITAPFQGGVLLTGVALASGQDNLIAHNLGRIPKVWMLCNLNADARIWSPASTSLGGANWNAQYVNLRSSATATVALWVA